MQSFSFVPQALFHLRKGQLSWSPKIGKVGIINRAGKQPRDSTRIRIDSAGLVSPYPIDPKVYLNPCGKGWECGWGYYY
ncbi:MAG: hypothetical protein WBE68_13045 [Candidatus Nitrosopolaris sp.]